jgi:hypothetical protein
MDPRGSDRSTSVHELVDVYQGKDVGSLEYTRVPVELDNDILNIGINERRTFNYSNHRRKFLLEIQSRIQVNFLHLLFD